MLTALVFLLALAAVWGMVGLFRFLAVPPKGPLWVLLPAQGDGDGLAEALRHIQWLNRENLSALTPLVVDQGLSDLGRATLAALQRQNPWLSVCTPDQLPQFSQRKDCHDPHLT